MVSSIYREDVISSALPLHTFPLFLLPFVITSKEEGVVNLSDPGEPLSHFMLLSMVTVS